MQMVKMMGRWALLLSLLAAMTAGVALADAPLQTVKGHVKAVANKSKTISIVLDNKNVMVIGFDDATVLKNIKTNKELQPGDAVAIDYRSVAQGELATVITKALIKLPDGVKGINSAELAALVKKGPAAGNYLLIDARPAGKFQEGHLPTAVSIPFAELEKEGEKLLPADKQKPLIFYCGGPTCVLSPKSAELAKKFGFTNLTVYTDGEPGWKKSDYYTVPTVEFVKTGNLVIIDLRDAKAVSAGHIPRAVNIPSAQLESADKMFPAFKGAPIVLYADQDDSLPAAGSTIRDWGYTNVMVFPGAVKAWQAKGFELATGAAATTIAYVRKLSPAEISIAEFEQGMKVGTLMVIDVRTPEEYAKGHFKNAIHIPTEQMAKRYSELPKDKPLALHCSTGARAEMAYDILSAKGVKARFLKAKVDFADDGTPQITEE